MTRETDHPLPDPFWDATLSVRFGVHTGGMRGLRPEEEWARQFMERTLDASVRQHDDNSQDGMHDLEIRSAGERIGAVEVTAAADGESIALWKVMDGDERWIEPGIRGGWMVALLPSARGKEIKKRLPALLRQLEEHGETSVRLGRSLRQDGAFPGLADLGVTSAHQSGTDYPGSIYVTIDLPVERSTGMVADTGEALSAWVGEFLGGPACADVRAKLDRSGAIERHVVLIIPGFTSARFGVIDLLMRDDAPLPVTHPSLPDEVTHIWAASTWSSGVGMRWAPERGWSYFDR